MPGITPPPSRIRSLPNVTPRPIGNKREFTETAKATPAPPSWITLVELTPTDGKIFDLAYFAAGCTEDMLIRLKWDGEVITPVLAVMGKTFPQFWVPSEYQQVTGDGSKKFELEAQRITTEGNAYGEIVGEEV